MRSGKRKRCPTLTDDVGHSDEEYGADSIEQLPSRKTKIWKKEDPNVLGISMASSAISYHHQAQLINGTL